MSILDKEIKKEPKYGHVIQGVNQLSLGISMVVAVALGVAIGIGLKTFFEADWLLFVGIFWGVAAAFLNVFKEYQKQKKDLDQLAEDRRSKFNNPDQEYK
jgi:F0F1-type ATP synthase assembly protein I